VPTYQYACTDCGDESEVVQRFTDDPLTVCSACGGKLRKVFSPVGIVFKGSGFYRTDSRNGSGAVRAGKDKDKDKDTAASSSSPSSTTDKSANGSSADSGSSKATAGSSAGGDKGGDKKAS
jgi:putative FmdB family regulatory protein